MKHVFLALAILIFYGCQSHDDHTHDDQNDHAHEHSSVSVSQWTDAMELFMEYEKPVTRHPIKFIIHLTTLVDFQPVREGQVELEFIPAGGAPMIIKMDQLLREGIFTPETEFDRAGEYRFVLRYSGAKAVETFQIGNFTVSDEHEGENDEDNAPFEEISFLKEQQWKIDFATEEAQMRKIRESVEVVGLIKPKPSLYAEVTAPVEGILSLGKGSALANPGQRVTKGQTLAVLNPPLVAGNSWAGVYLEYDRARAEFERAGRLRERQAISDKEYENTYRAYEAIRAGYESYFGSGDKSNTMRFDPQNRQFELTAPINGIVGDVRVLPGQRLLAGEKIMHIVDPSIVWLRLDIFESQLALLDLVGGISVDLPGHSQTIHLNGNQIHLVSRGEVIDPVKRTATMWLEASNRENHFRLGQSFNARIYTDALEEKVCVPKTAVYDDDLKKVVFIHIEGETFEKREVKTGAYDSGYVVVLSGLQPGERVVTRGGYQVKLASTSETIGHPHTH